MDNFSVKSMRSTMKLWIGSLTCAGLLLAGLAVGQDFPTLKGNNARTGRNATPAISNPGRGRLTWFRPNATDTISGTIVRNNTAIGPNVTSTGAWTASPMTNAAAFFYDQPSFGDVLSDQATGAFAVYGAPTPYDGRTPAYAYTNTAAGTNQNNPITGFTSSWTWQMDPTQPPLNEAPGVGKKYALYVWLPIGSTDTGVRSFPQRFFVYQVRYGPGAASTFTDVIDTYAAGAGWVRIGNGGLSTNRQFTYDGANPITITLFNTVPRDPTTGTLTDTPGTSLVYADAAMAVPQIGEMQATPTVANLNSGITSTFAAINEFSIGQREGQDVTVSQGVVTSYDYATGARRWVFRPAEQTFTFSMDDQSANVTPSAGFGQVTVGVGTATATGTTYRRATIALGGTEGVVYSTDPPGPGTSLDDGQYEIQVYISPSVLAEAHGNSVKVLIREAGVDIPFYIDQDRGPGWFQVGGRKFTHTDANPLRVEITNDTNLGSDVGKFSYADGVRFIGSFDAQVNSTPTMARVNIRQPGGAVVPTDVVIVCCEDGHIYCLDAQGNANGTTNVIWAYPSIPDPTNATWVDPNITAGIDGDGAPTNPTRIAEMPVGFGRSSPIVQTVGGNDYVYIAARNGRVYAIDATGRGDYDFAAGRPGTTTRIWSYPSDYPSARRSGTLGSFTNASLAYAEVGGTPRLYVPTESGHLIALNPVGNVGTRTTNELWNFPGKNLSLAPVTTTPVIEFGRIYFGTALDNNGNGTFFSLDAQNGLTPQQFVTQGAFVGGAVTVPAAELGGVGQVDTVYVTNQNRNVYALDAANIGTIIWNTEELNTTVTGPLSYTPMMVFDQLGVPAILPTVIVPGDNGSFSALFARGGATVDAINVFGGKLAWQNIAPNGIVAGTSVGGPNLAPGFMYGGDLSGNLYAWSNTNLLPGQGIPPIDEVIVPNDPAGALFRDGKLKVIDKNLYDQLRNDPTAVVYNTVDTLPQTPPYAFEWGQTAYFVVYGFPAQEDTTGAASQTQSLVNFQISTDGATTRQFAVVARSFATAPADKDGYAILAFAIQGSGPNSLPPGRGRVSYTVTPGRTAGNAPVQVAQNPGNGLVFQVANPIAIKMSASGLNDGIGVTNVTNDPGSLVNGSPDLASTGGNNETLLTSSIGLIGHSQTGSSTIYVYDRSLMTLLRGPDRGVDQVRVQRPELAWIGGAGAISKPIPPFFGTLFEDLPDEQPNISLDYPNIRAENVSVTKDPNGQAENPGFSGVFLNPPTQPGGGAIDETNFATRQLNPTLFQFDVNIPRFQPANYNNNWTDSAGNTIKSGYTGRVNVFVDSNQDGALNTIGGRLEAYRGFWLNGAVAIDESVIVRTPNLDLGSIPGGGGYTPDRPGMGTGAFTPWGPTVGLGSEFPAMFKPITVENPGNVNLLNVRVAKATNNNGTIGSWAIFSSSVDEFGWLDARVGLWSDIDSTFARTPQVIVPKARVGDRGNSVLQTNPTWRANPNLDTNGGRFLPAPFSDDPRVAVTVPIGFPVGTYSGLIRVIEDTRTVDEALDLNSNVALEAYSDPSVILTFKVRETRFTNTNTLLTAPMADDPAVLGTGAAAFLHTNLQPTATRTIQGDVVAAWTSTRASDAATQPTQASGNDQYRIYLTGLNGNDGTPDARGDFFNGVKDLTGFVVGSAVKWFQPSPSSTNGYPGAGYVFPTAAGESIVAGTEKYGAPSFPAKGYVNPFNPVATFGNIEMAFIGDAMKQTPSGRSAESRLFMSRLTVDNAGVPSLDATPSPMPWDPASQKGKPSVLKLDADRSLVFYSALGAGNSNIFWTLFDYSQIGNATTGGYTQPQTLDFGEGFESLGSPSISGRTYSGVDPNIPAGSRVAELGFTGKLRGRQNSEVFVGRILLDGTGAPQSIANFPQIQNEVLTPDRETGQFRAIGVEWDRNATIDVGIDTGVPGPIPSIKTGTAQINNETGLITFNTTLGGKAYIDPRMGTVRLSTGLPLTTSRLVLTYTPKFKRISVGTTAGHVGVSMFMDSRFDSVTPPNNTRYWALPNGNGIAAGDHPRTNRLFFSYNRAAAGAGQSARPYMKTMRLGVQLQNQIYTNQLGNVVGLTITPAPNDYYQVDPIKGRIYFSPADEDRQFTIRYNPIDSSTGAPLAAVDEIHTVSWVNEMNETLVPIEQAVNESGLFAFPDPFDAAAFQRPNLVWMFWSSTRGGAPDIYFQTVAPRFAPQVRGN